MSLIDRVVKKKKLSDPDQPWRYWLTRPVEERLAAVEELRCEYHGWTHGSEPIRVMQSELLCRSKVSVLMVSIGNLEVPFVSIDDLRTNKLATGRLRDIADAADLPPTQE